MTSNIFSGSAIPVLEQVVNFAQARQNVLAGNLANMDTPGYKARDISLPGFQDKLKEAIEARDTQSTSVTRDMEANDRANPFDKVGEAVSGILYHDESNDSLEKMTVEQVKNAMMHDLAVTVMRAQFEVLRAAISERV